MSRSPLNKYRVHIYREMRLVFDGIEAETPEAAAQIAGDKPFDDCDDWSDCEGVNIAALVDHAPHDGTLIDFEAGRLIAAGAKLTTILGRILYEIDSEIEQRQHGGNNEDWAHLKILSDEAHALVREACGGCRQPESDTGDLPTTGPS
jgi:hypothetical protein